jgi:hypothetical protein
VHSSTKQFYIHEDKLLKNETNTKDIPRKRWWKAYEYIEEHAGNGWGWARFLTFLTNFFHSFSHALLHLFIWLNDKIHSSLILCFL